jgi:arylsulfatase A-like enzyme
MKTICAVLIGLLLTLPATAAERPFDSAGSTALTTGQGRPNIVLIFADDLGYGDVGCYGGKLTPTPAIDALARDGVRCTAGYVTAPVCAPSRCGLMTGAYNQRFGIQWNDDRSKYNVGTHKVLPQALKAAGYVTGHIGKWNVGADIAGCFDETFDTIDWEADYFPDKDGHYYGVDSATEHASSKRQGLWGPERPGEEYLTDRLGRHAVEFISKHKRGAQPFFLYLAFNAVHSPYHAPKQVEARYSQLQPPLNYFAAMLASLDENVGRVLAAVPENTLVVFASDNGPAKMPVQKWPEGWPTNVLAGSAGPLNGHKGQMLEGGIREPFILRWPGRLKGGHLYHQPVMTMDLYATFLAAAGAPVPAGTKLDGVNLLPFLTGAQPGTPHDILFWKNAEHGAVRQGDWKLVLSPWPPKLQLFNLADDIGEKNDLAAEKPELAEKLHKAWLDWGATLPPRASPAPAKAGKGKQTAAPGSAEKIQERTALFATKDRNNDGRLSWEEFFSHQADETTLKSRFKGWDADTDGFLSRDEFIHMSGKPK